MDPNYFIDLRHLTPFSVPSVKVDSTPPQVNYVASYPMHLTRTQKDPFCSCSTSFYLVLVVDLEISSMRELESIPPLVGPSEWFDIHFI